jgi:NAD(P)-dependent dehydrogenase (short-subunit alcohol dehydrogenase family)
MTSTQLTGTTAIVTGASRGFGRAITLALTAHGASVVGVARDETALKELAGKLGPSFTGVAADVTDESLAAAPSPITGRSFWSSTPAPRPIQRLSRTTRGSRSA